MHYEEILMMESTVMTTLGNFKADDTLSLVKKKDALYNYFEDHTE